MIKGAQEKRSGFTKVTIVAGIVVLTVAGVGFGEVVAQETKEINTTLGNEPEAQNQQVNLIARSETTVEVGETIALGFPKSRFPTDGSYHWNITQGPTKDEDQLLYTGTEDIEHTPRVNNVPEEIPPHNARVTSFRPSKSGTYVIEGTINGDTYTSQEIEVVHTKVGGMEKLKLLKRHAPILNFHPEENYRPTRIEALFEN